MATILDGKALSNTILNELKEEVNDALAKGHRPPGLAVIIVGNNPASASYVRNKMKACKQAGFFSKQIHLDESCSQNELLKHIEVLNQDSSIDGFIVQLPLPKHIHVDEVIEAIDPAKDVDGFHPMNVGNVTLGRDAFVSATPHGIQELLHRYHIETKGKHVVVIGRSNIVGRPMSILLSGSGISGNATVTLTHRHTQHLESITKQADIVVVAVGIPNLLTANMVKEGAIVIDVGINRVDDATKKRGYKLVGDADYKAIESKASAITPVPGGVGPMTVCSLMMNTMKSYRKRL